MSALAEKMKSAGIDTVGARLTAACVGAIRQHPGSIQTAWNAVGASFGYEFLRGLVKDMEGPAITVKEPSTVEAIEPVTVVIQSSTDGGSTWSAPISHKLGRELDSSASTLKLRSQKPYTPRVVPTERLNLSRKMQEAIRSKYKSSGGIAWSEVGWHELPLLKRDGTEASALWNSCSGEIPNDGRTVGDVLGVKKIDEIIEAVRKKGRARERS